jgi:hypothetical protein
MLPFSAAAVIGNRIAFRGKKPVEANIVFIIKYLNNWMTFFV